jgi:hypothetical protein
VIILFRKISLNIVAIFMANSSSVDPSSAKYRQGLVALFILFSSFVTHIMFKPYEDEKTTGIFSMNFMETLSIAVGILSIYLGLWTFAKDVNETVQFGVTFTILTLNFIFIAFVTMMVFKSVRTLVIGEYLMA